MNNRERDEIVALTSRLLLDEDAPITPLDERASPPLIPWSASFVQEPRLWPASAGQRLTG
ncbi:hypothetical protein BE08_21965 [Sorangium cellulosum]|uniref:Uncharacterized protein n=1 Tax=Sorangium cellulosum TaxID=56 RepID=A0A150PAL2_SORCE|nr:hypothetical protein BE08_21965 [Sorangium cellulosum]